MTNKHKSKSTTSSANRPTGRNSPATAAVNRTSAPWVDGSTVDAHNATGTTPRLAMSTVAMIKETLESDREPTNGSSDPTAKGPTAAPASSWSPPESSSSVTTRQLPSVPIDPQTWPTLSSLTQRLFMSTSNEVVPVLRVSAPTTAMTYEHVLTTRTTPRGPSGALASEPGSKEAGPQVQPTGAPNPTSLASHDYNTPHTRDGVSSTTDLGGPSDTTHTSREVVSNLPSESAWRRIYDGAEVVISHPYSSQYAQGNSVSACGLAALNFVKVLFDKENRGMHDEGFLEDLMSSETVEEITAICPLWTIDAHLEVEEIHEMPFFHNALHLQYTQFGQPRLRDFKALLGRLEATSDPNRSAAVVITRPPEIIACVRVPTSRGTIFVLFDSHPRPGHPQGAGLTFNKSIEETATALNRLLAVDGQLFRGPDMDWQAQLLGNFSGHIFLPKDQADVDMDIATQVTDQSILQASITSLEERTKLRTLEGEVHSLKQDVQQLENRLRVQRQDNATHSLLQREKIESLEAENARLRRADRGSYLPRFSIFSSGKEKGEDGDPWKTAGRSNTESIGESSRPRLSYTSNAESERLGHLEHQMREDKAHDSMKIRNLEEENEMLKATIESLLQKEKESAPAQERAAARSEERSVQTVVEQEEDTVYMADEDATDEWEQALRNSETDRRAYMDADETARIVREVLEEEQPEIDRAKILNTAPNDPEYPEEGVVGVDAQDDEVDFQVYLDLIAALEGSSNDEVHRGPEAATGSQPGPSGATSYEKAADMGGVESDDDSFDYEKQSGRLVMSDDGWWRSPPEGDEEEEVTTPATSVSSNSGRPWKPVPILDTPLNTSGKGKKKDAEGLPPSLSVFHCGICLEDVLREDVAPVDICGHDFCRDCLRNYVVSKLSEHRFPINCPICASQSSAAKPGLITEFLIEQLGIPESAYVIYTDLQLAEFSIPVKCRGCENEVAIDREEHDAAAILVCPLSCGYRWCKTCQQETPFGLEHSCDGAAELDYLLTNEGWKRCPGCQTPIQKADGCNHMTCITPACNTHFCYTCGELVIKSDRPSEINPALAAHYNGKCALFRVPPEA